MATLVIAANIPDIDAVAATLGTQSLAIRRGITHGPVAMAVLPLMLTGLVLLYDRWRPSAVPVRSGPLLLLAYLGTLSHPGLDWLNSYGIRLLEPFGSRWFAGDTLFIIDVWIWAALLIAFFWSRRAEKRGGNWTRPAWAGALAISAYIAANGLITTSAEALGRDAYRWERNAPADLVVANPMPLAFWQRTILWRGDGDHGVIDYHLFDARNYAGWRGGRLGAAEPLRLDHPALAAARGRPDVEAFLFWSRMPLVTEENGAVVLKDQRFNTRFTRGSFTVPLQ